MGIVTLFCNLAAAIGFAVFALTRSEILQEFGVVAGINKHHAIVLYLSYSDPGDSQFIACPESRHIEISGQSEAQRWLDRLERWSFNHRTDLWRHCGIDPDRIGIFRLKSVGYIVDDLPKTDKIYTDLKFFEKNFKGSCHWKYCGLTPKRNMA